MPQIVEKGKSALGHKIGPLPLWGWVVGGAAAVFVVKKFRGSGGGGSAGGQGITIPTLQPGSGSSLGDASGSSTAVVSPAQNVQGGSDTAPGGVAPWWANPPAWWNAAPAVPLLNSGPSTNGSAGTNAPTTGLLPWFTRVPTGGRLGFPAGAAVADIGGTKYSLSDAALKRAPITGAVPANLAAGQPTSGAADVRLPGGRLVD